MTAHVISTVIGSYPVTVDTMDLMNHYFKGVFPSWKPYITTAVNDMIDAGVELLSDGQTRDPFMNIFLRKLKGCRLRERAEVVDVIEHDQPITVDDLRYVKTLLPEGKKLLGLVVGPYTLSESVVDTFYHDKKQLAFDFAKALKKEVVLLQSVVDMISIDEPFFSNVYPEYAPELIKTITKDISLPVRLHVCGDVSAIVPNLVDMPVDVLSHEFKASPHLLDVFAEYESKKAICLGAVRSDSIQVEPVEEIMQHIQKSMTVFGERIVQIAPDCGQRLLPREIAFQKLHHLVIAKEMMYE